MRQNIYELLKNRALNVQEEFNILYKLYAEEYSIDYAGQFCSVEEYIDATYFRSLPIRGTCLSLSDLFDRIGLNTFDVTIDTLLLFCEFLFAITPDEELKCNPDFDRCVNTIFGNIEAILEKTNHELTRNADGNYIIVAKNNEATLAAQLVDENVAYEIMEYNHFAIKGDLDGKRKILNIIAAYIEPILNCHTLKDNGNEQLEKDMGFVLNNFNIRHNNKEGTKANDYIASINPDDLEEWYDKAYQLAISVIIMVNYMPIKQEIKNIKQQYAFKN